MNDAWLATVAGAADVVDSVLATFDGLFANKIIISAFRPGNATVELFESFMGQAVATWEITS